MAELDDKIIGNIFGTHDGAFIGYIYKVAVAKEYRRYGIAYKLINSVVNAFDNLGIDLKFCHIHNDNLASIKLFKKINFEIRDTHKLLDLGYKSKIK